MKDEDKVDTRDCGWGLDGYGMTTNLPSREYVTGIVIRYVSK